MSWIFAPRSFYNFLTFEKMKSLIHGSGISWEIGNKSTGRRWIPTKNKSSGHDEYVFFLTYLMRFWNRDKMHIHFRLKELFISCKYGYSILQLYIEMELELRWKIGWERKKWATRKGWYLEIEWQKLLTHAQYINIRISLRSKFEPVHKNRVSSNITLMLCGIKKYLYTKSSIA